MIEKTFDILLEFGEDRATTQEINVVNLTECITKILNDAVYFKDIDDISSVDISTVKNYKLFNF